MKIGFIGLGNMGMALVQSLKEHQVDVVAWNRSPHRREVAGKLGIEVVDSIAQLINSLDDQDTRIVFSLVSAGSATQEVLFGSSGLVNYVRQGDIVVDLANSHYKTTIERYQKFKDLDVRFVDCGISGGVAGARNGASIMVGGDKDAVDILAPIFEKISVEDGYGYFGPAGAGHFVKMVHNAIEYGMMQAIAEGLNLVAKSDYQISYSDLTKVWNNGSIISSNLINYLNQAFNNDSHLSGVSGEVGSLGTAKWAVEEALERGVPFDSIANAVFTRFESRGDDKFSHQIVQAMREVFGSHDSQERPESR